jgi:hypothetical protein
MGRAATLHYAKSTPIKRHVKVKGEANPYDPTYETYFEETGSGSHAGNGGRKAVWLLGNDLRIHSSSALRVSTMSSLGRIVNSDGCGVCGSR